MKVEKYPKAMRMLHWLMAAAVFSQIALGFLMEDQGEDIVLIHACLGAAILTLAVIRIFVMLRFKGSLPKKPEELTEIKWKLAKIGHGLIYILLVCVPISGLLGFFSGDHELEELHETLVWIFIFLLAGHILITIKHQLMDKIAILQRMT